MAIIHNLIARFRADTGAFDRNVKKSRTHMTRFGRDVQRMGKQLLAIAGIGGGIYALKRGLTSVVKAAMEQEKAEKLLRAATGKSIISLKRYAAEMQKLTIYGDEQILIQMAFAKNLGVTTEQLGAATKAAIGLAAKYSLELATSMMLVGRASKGQTQMLTRYGIVLNESLSAQEKFNSLLKIGADAFRLAEAEAKTNESAMRRLRNEIGDLAEIIGGPLADAMARNARQSTKFFSEHKVAFSRYIKDIEEGTQIWWNFWKAVGRKTPAGLIIGALKKRDMPESIAKPDEFAWDPVRQRIIERGREEMKMYQEAIEVEKGLQELKQIGRKRLLDGLIKEGKKRNEVADNQRRIYTDIARGMAQEWSNAFDQMLFEGKKFADAMTDLLRGILRMVTQIMTYEMIAKPIAAGMMGMPVSELHSGGIVGQTSRTRRMPAMAFAGAPRLHSGFAGDEYPAILQRGEQVIPRGGGGAAPTIIINNNTGQKLRQESEPMYDGKQWIIRVVADDIQQGGTLRKMVQGVK